MHMMTPETLVFILSDNRMHVHFIHASWHVDELDGFQCYGGSFIGEVCFYFEIQYCGIQWQLGF